MPYVSCVTTNNVIVIILVQPNLLTGDFYATYLFQNPEMEFLNTSGFKVIWPCVSVYFSL